ncbi:unnamed protein product [Leuciscus chuanchicus]
MPRNTLSLEPAMPAELVKDTMTIPGAPERILAEKTNNNEPPAAVTIPLVNEVQLTAATGGAELSCYRCTVPFGVVVLIAGIVVTAVAYSFNSHGSTISYFGLVLLSAGLVLLALSAVCWKVRMERKKERRREKEHLRLISTQARTPKTFTVNESNPRYTHILGQCPDVLPPVQTNRSLLPVRQDRSVIWDVGQGKIKTSNRCANPETGSAVLIHGCFLSGRINGKTHFET